MIEIEYRKHHSQGYPDRPLPHSSLLEDGGYYKWRADGEYHQFNPQSVALLQNSTRLGDYQIFRQFTDSIDSQSQHLGTLRGLFQFKKVQHSVPIEEVEPVQKIVKRFSTGAMSFGSISKEAHETLAIAMNRIGGKSNTGEGGEDPLRFTPEENGD